jgi:hypothetical protein
LVPSQPAEFAIQGVVIMKASLKSITFAMFAAAAAAFLAAGTASAERPPNLAGTTWTMQINREVNQLVITSQSGEGAPGAAICRIINGTFGVANIRGWYCPSTGRIHFLHKNAGVTARTFTGNVSDDVIGQTLYMAGTMAVDDANFGDYGEYNFSATR